MHNVNRSVFLLHVRFPSSAVNRKSLYDSEEGLTGSQIQRGAFMNSGSKDVGRDPEWDRATRKWMGKHNKPDDG